ncbi:5548_t:CDS:2, partial [Entrophospora sp. SA101]
TDEAIEELTKLIAEKEKQIDKMNLGDKNKMAGPIEVINLTGQVVLNDIIPLYVARGTLYHSKGNQKEAALKDFNNALGINSNTMEPINYTKEQLRALCYRGCINRSLVDFHKVLENEPNNILALCERSAIYRDLDYHTIAWQNIKKVLDEPMFDDNNAHSILLLVRIVVFEVKIPITRGYNVILHRQSLNEPAIITRLKSIIDKTTGEQIKKNPRHIPKSTAAIVEIQLPNRPIPIETFKDNKELGRIMIRKGVIAPKIKEAHKSLCADTIDQTVGKEELQSYKPVAFSLEQNWILATVIGYKPEIEDAV